MSLISRFIIISCKFNAVTLNKRTNLTCPKWSSSINMLRISAKQSFYLKTKTFSDDFFKSTWQGLRLPMFCTTTNPRLKFFCFSSCQKIKILHRIRFNQEIMAKVFTEMHQLSINLLCSSDYQTTYSFCEIKHFVKQAKSLWIHFQELLLENIT